MADQDIPDWASDAQPGNSSASEGSQSSVPDWAQEKTAEASAKAVTPQRGLGEEAFRQVGLAGRDIAGAIPMAAASVGDLANTGINYATGAINKYTGTHIPQLGMPTEDIQRGLSATGAFPEYENKAEKGVGTAASIMLGGGENTVPLLKEAASNVAPKIKQFLADEGTTAGRAAEQNATSLARPTAEQLREVSGRVFDIAKEKGAVFTPEASMQAANGVERTLLQTGKMNGRLHGDTLSALEDMKNDAATKNLDLEDLQQYRQLFGDVVNKNLYPNGKMMPDAMKASQAQDAIDRFLNRAGSQHILNGSTEGIEALNQARPLWAQAARMDDIQRIMERAELSQNPATAMQQGFKSLYTNGRRMRGFSPDEAALIKKAAQSSLPVEYLRAAGSRLLGIAGMGSGNIAEMVAAPAVNAAARNYAAMMQGRRGNDILDALASRNELPNLIDKEPPLQLPPPSIKTPPGGFKPAEPEPQPQRSLPKPGYDPFAPEEIKKLPPPAKAKEVPPRGFSGHRYEPQDINLPTEPYGPNQTSVLSGEKSWINNPYDVWNPGPNVNEQKRGGRVKKLRHGAIYAKPKRYPAIEAMRQK